MGAAKNRKRTHKRNAEERSAWGFLFRPEEKEVDKGGFYRQAPEEEEPVAPRRFSLSSLLHTKINIWSLFATALFLLFTLAMAIVVLRMWIPQNLEDIAGYDDNRTSRDLKDAICQANGSPVVITEAELNRYLRETCRMSQTGIFSIITHCHGVAARVHDGYLEIVFDRIIGANLHQTTSAYLTFTQTNKLGRPELQVEFRGRSPLLGTMPTGGRIGQVLMPQRHIRMLQPALESMLSCYPEITEAVERYHYCPVFNADSSEHRITLIPYSPS